jgi:hypothetical protein
MKCCRDEKGRRVMATSQTNVQGHEERHRPFAESRRLLVEYVELQGSRDPTFPVHLMAEAKIRLDQLDYVLDRVREIEGPPIALGEKYDRGAVLFMYVDAFYQVVTRLKTLFHKNKVLGLKAFEPKASLELRGNLISHPEGPNGVHVLS